MTIGPITPQCLSATQFSPAGGSLPTPSTQSVDQHAGNGMKDFFQKLNEKNDDDEDEDEAL